MSNKNLVYMSVVGEVVNNRRNTEEVLFWSNENGWGSLNDATKFESQEIMYQNLPLNNPYPVEVVHLVVAKSFDKNYN